VYVLNGGHVSHIAVDEQKSHCLVGLVCHYICECVVANVIVFVCFSCCNSCCGLCWTGDLSDDHLLWSRLSSQVTDCSGLAEVQVTDERF